MSITWSLVSFISPLTTIAYINHNMLPEKPAWILLLTNLALVILGAIFLPELP